MATPSNSPIPEDYIIICNICNQEPLDMNKVEIDQIHGQLFLEDINGDIWLYCFGCDKFYHLRCVDNIPQDITPEEFEDYYWCSDCGWGMI